MDGDDDALRVASKDGLSPMLDNLAIVVLTSRSSCSVRRLRHTVEKD